MTAASPTQSARLLTPGEAGIQEGKSARRTRVWEPGDGSRWLLKMGGDPGPAIAAYHMSERYFGGVVPETLFVEWAGLGGSAQRMVDGPTAHELLTLQDDLRNPASVRCLANMVVMDWMLANPDRHANNWIVSPSGRVWAIDNGKYDPDLTFQSAMAPVYRADMDSDAEWSPHVWNAMWDTTEALTGRGRSAAAVYKAWGGRELSAATWEDRAGILKGWLEIWSRELSEPARH